VTNVVQAPKAQPPRLGLLVSAITPPEPLDRIEALGYQSEACGGYKLLDPCEGIEVARGYPLSTPPAPTLGTAATGGTLEPGTYSYRLAARDANGTTVPGPANTITVPAGTSTNVVTVDWPDISGATSYDVYGRTAGSELLLANVAVSTYADTGDPGRQVSYVPFAVLVEDHCSAFGWQAHDYLGRAERRLRAVESAAIARELWTGELAAAAGHTNNRRLADATTTENLTPSAAVSLTRGVAELEDAIAGCLDGGRAMIHMTRGTAFALAQGGGLRREGNLLLTVNDSIVVPDAGYPGTSPAGVTPAAGERWAYATPMVTVRRSTPRIVPDTLAEAIDKDLNTIAYSADLLAAVTFDCCAFAARLTLA
jgi:hypothetical protein